MFFAWNRSFYGDIRTAGQKRAEFGIIKNLILRF